MARAFHEAIRALPHPPFLSRRTHAWAQADRVAWGEEPLLIHQPALQPLARELAATLMPIREPAQLIHGDLSANVLFADGQAPAIIDFTPYWRPASFALAIVIADAITWFGGAPELLDERGSQDQARAMVARALLFRLVAADRLLMGSIDADSQVTAQVQRFNHTAGVLRLHR